MATFYLVRCNWILITQHLFQLTSRSPAVAWLDGALTIQREQRNSAYSGSTLLRDSREGRSGRVLGFLVKIALVRKYAISRGPGNTGMNC